MASSRPSWRTAAGAVLGAGLAAVLRGELGAQSTAPVPTPAVAQRVAGRVLRPAADSTTPAPNSWVTLHRVGSDAQGPLDSIRVGADGRFSFSYRRTGSPDAVYFVSASYGGIAYLGEPLRDDAPSATADVTVFDTTSSPIPITVRGRHLIVSAAAPSGRRTVTEVFELSNDTTLTAVAPPGGATFTTPLPEGAADPQVGSGDVPGEAVSFGGGRAQVSAPFSPGLKQLAFTYTLPPGEFPLSVPVLRGADVLEVLVEEPTAEVTGAGLTAVNPATVSGRTFKRFLAQTVAPNALVRVSVPAPPALGRDAYLLALATVIGGAMLAALVRSLAFRRRLVPASAAAPSSERIAQEIAALDTSFERRPAASETERSSYVARRAELKAQLTAALAERAGPR